ncbi:MAG TPA: hypothetical protein PLL69_06815 [Gemmatimonadales bacterium]|nr:hypothetical protein [Gemmatimonadales bacterium]
MPCEPRTPALALLAAVVVPAAILAGQASPPVPLDDPHLPLFEHLIDRGTIADPSPFVRPFRVSDALAALRAASRNADSTLVDRLIAVWTPPEPESWWSVTVRAGGEGFTAARRDPLRPEGEGGFRVLGDVRGVAVLGPVVMVTRPTIEQRIAVDPDWTGQRVSSDATCCRWHFPEAAIQYQQGPFRFHLGQVARNWGPVGIDGIAMSNVAYSRDDVAFEIGGRDLQVISTVGFLRDTIRDDGTPIRRYHVASRIGMRLGRHWQLGGWQSAVLEGESRDVEGPFRNPMVLLPLINQYGLGDRDNNVMVGVQLGWQSGTGLQLQGELALDDLIQRNRENFPDRWAMTLRPSGPGPAGSTWRGIYTRASSLAFRASDPFESFTERGVGLGRGWADGDRVELRFARPVSPQLLATVTVSGYRQGESRLADPIPEERPIPGFLTGTVQRTLRLAGGLAGTIGPVDLSGELGVNSITNDDHTAGRNRSAVEGRVRAVLRLGHRSRLE